MRKDLKKAELVFIPTPGIGHVTSTIEVAKLVTDLNDKFSVTVLIMRLPTDQKSIPESSDPRIRFLELRREEEHSSSQEVPVPHHLQRFHFIDEHKAHVREILAGIARSESSTLAGIVIDMFCTSMIGAANEFGAPSYLFYTSSASVLGLLLHMQSLRDDFNVDPKEFQNSDSEIVISTYVNPVPAKVLPSGFFQKGLGDIFLNHARRFRETRGIIINTFQELESHAIQALCTDIEPVPPVYPIGPLINLNGISTTEENRESTEEIMTWLDLHPVSSVVFLCFGSLGTFSVDQLHEIACALENSGCRFLWSLRKPPPPPPPKGVTGYNIPDDYENPEEVLPEGFLQRTAEVGKVIGWAPQVAVLSHPAVGGFVSHCGWNSTLESIWCGVPVAAWPMYAEQQANAFLLIKELEMAVEIKMDYVRGGAEIVGSDVIENGIKRVMDRDENGMMIRNKVREMQMKSRSAVSQPGGSSSDSLRCFLNNVLDNIP